MSSFLKTTSHYRASVKRLVRDYPSVIRDIEDALKEYTLADLFLLNYIIKDSGVARIIKRRVANSDSKKGKSAGFRVYFIVCKKTNRATLIEVFAKVGAQGKDNLSRQELKQAIECYKDENLSNNLQALIADIDKEVL